jgi:hypothetical protein
VLLLQLRKPFPSSSDTRICVLLDSPPPALLSLYCPVLPTEPAEGSSKAQKVVFATVRPADYSLPYSTMEKNSVAFSAVDKRSNKLLTVMVRVGVSVLGVLCWAGCLVPHNRTGIASDSAAARTFAQSSPLLSSRHCRSSSRRPHMFVCR